MLFPFFIDFSSNSKGNVPFHLIAYEYSCADWDDLHVPWEDIFQVGAPAATEFCDYVQVEIYIYIYIHIYTHIYIHIPPCKYQLKPSPSPWFAAPSVAATAYRNHCLFVSTK